MVTPPSKVLVTGANGYIAVWVVDTLLKAGYTVRGTVRGWNKTKDLKDKFADFVKSGKLEFVIVEDITVVRAHNSTQPKVVLLILFYA